MREGRQFKESNVSDFFATQTNMHSPGNHDFAISICGFPAGDSLLQFSKLLDTQTHRGIAQCFHDKLHRAAYAALFVSLW